MNEEEKRGEKLKNWMPSEELNEFNVYQFFVDGQYEQVVSRVGPEKAMKTAARLAHSVGGRMGTTQRIIITDGGDCINFEWRFGEGIVYPKIDYEKN